MKYLSRLNVIQRIIILLRQVATHESDTTALLRNLSTSDNNHIDSVLRTLSHVRGPWAFVYYQVSINRT